MKKIFLYYLFIALTTSFCFAANTDELAEQFQTLIKEKKYNEAQGFIDAHPVLAKWKNNLGYSLFTFLLANPSTTMSSDEYVAIAKTFIKYGLDIIKENPIAFQNGVKKTILEVAASKDPKLSSLLSFYHLTCSVNAHYLDSIAKLYNELNNLQESSELSQMIKTFIDLEFENKQTFLHKIVKILPDNYSLPNFSQEAINSSNNPFTKSILQELHKQMNTPDANGNTPLHCAANIKHVKQLYAYGANKLTKNNEDQIPAETIPYDCRYVLTDRQAYRDAKNKLFSELKQGNIQSACSILDTYSQLLNKQDDDGNTPLHLATIATCKGNFKDLSFFTNFFKIALPTRQQNKKGETFLHLAIQNTTEFNAHHIKTLLEAPNFKDANPTFLNIQDNNGQTALHHAAYKGYDFVRNILIQKGINQSLKDNFGKTAAECTPTTYNAPYVSSSQPTTPSTPFSPQPSADPVNRPEGSQGGPKPSHNTSKPSQQHNQSQQHPIPPVTPMPKQKNSFSTSEKAASWLWTIFAMGASGKLLYDDWQETKEDQPITFKDYCNHVKENPHEHKRLAGITLLQLITLISWTS